MKGRIALTVFIVLCLAIVLVVPKPLRAEQVTVQLDWLVGGEHVAFFVARDGGFFKDKDLEVRLLEGRGSLQSATFVDAKQADFGYGDFLTAIQLIAKGGKNQAIGVGMAFQGGGYIFLEESGIKTPKDLEGKIFGTTPADFGYILLPGVAGAADFDHKKVVIKTVDAAVRTPLLLERKIDFISGASGSSILRMAILGKRQGKTINYLFFKDMGLNTYGHVLQAHSDKVKNNPDQVQRFVSALFDAWAWSIKNPKQAVEIFIKANPQTDREISSAQVGTSFDYVVDPETKQYGLGYMKESMVKQTVDVATRYFDLASRVDYKTVYTNQFIKRNPGL